MSRFGSRLTSDQVRAIRTSTRRQVDLAEEFGIPQSNISQIKRRVLYADVPDSLICPHCGKDALTFFETQSTLLS